MWHPQVGCGSRVRGTWLITSSVGHVQSALSGIAARRWTARFTVKLPAIAIVSESITDGRTEGRCSLQSVAKTRRAGGVGRSAVRRLNDVLVADLSTTGGDDATTTLLSVLQTRRRRVSSMSLHIVSASSRHWYAALAVNLSLSNTNSNSQV